MRTPVRAGDSAGSRISFAATLVEGNSTIMMAYACGPLKSTRDNPLGQESF